MIKATECNDDICPEDAGCLVATAYPERVAKAIDSIGHFRLASGATCRLTTVAILLPTTGWRWLPQRFRKMRKGVSRRTVAARGHRDTTTRTDFLGFKKRRCGDAARTHNRVLTVDSQPLHNAQSDCCLGGLRGLCRKEGLGLLDVERRRCQASKACGRGGGMHPEMALPDLSTEHVLSTASEWLPFYIEQNGKVLTTAAELKKINLHDALWALIPYDMQQEVDRLAPSHITVPSGSRIRVDYRKAAEAPVLSVRLQECFGMLHTPVSTEENAPCLWNSCRLDSSPCS